MFFTRFLHCLPVWYIDHFVFEMPIKILQKHHSRVHRVHALLCVEYPDTIAAAVASTTAATVVATTAATAAVTAVTAVTATTTTTTAAAAAAAVAARATRLLL